MRHGIAECDDIINQKQSKNRLASLPGKLPHNGRSAAGPYGIAFAA